MTRSAFALALLAPLFAALPAHAASRVVPGEWEQVMTITSTEMPGEPMQQTVRACITSADAATFSNRDTWAQEMVAANPQAKCKIQEAKEDGSVLSVVLACEGDVRLSVTHDFRGKTGTIDAETRIGGVVKGKNHIESKQVADACSPATIDQWKRQNPGKTFAP